MATILDLMFPGTTGNETAIQALDLVTGRPFDPGVLPALPNQTYPAAQTAGGWKSALGPLLAASIAGIGGGLAGGKLGAGAAMNTLTRNLQEEERLRIAKEQVINQERARQLALEQQRQQNEYERRRLEISEQAQKRMEKADEERAKKEQRLAEQQAADLDLQPVTIEGPDNQPIPAGMVKKGPLQGMIVMRNEEGKLVGVATPKIWKADKEQPEPRPSYEQSQVIQAMQDEAGGPVSPKQIKDELLARDVAKAGARSAAIAPNLPGFNQLVTDPDGRPIGVINTATKEYTSFSGVPANAFRGAIAPQRKQWDSNAREGLKAVEKVEQLLKENPQVLVKGAVPGAPFAREFDRARKEMVDVITRLRTGAALNNEEQAFYADYAPTLLDLTDPNAIKYKIETMKRFYNRFVIEGLNPPGPSGDSKDPMGLR